MSLAVIPAVSLSLPDAAAAVFPKTDTAASSSTASPMPSPMFDDMLTALSALAPASGDSVAADATALGAAPFDSPDEAWNGLASSPALSVAAWPWALAADQISQTEGENSAAPALPFAAPATPDSDWPAALPLWTITTPQPGANTVDKTTGTDQAVVAKQTDIAEQSENADSNAAFPQTASQAVPANDAEIGTGLVSVVAAAPPANENTANTANPPKEIPLPTRAEPAIVTVKQTGKENEQPEAPPAIAAPSHEIIVAQSEAVPESEPQDVQAAAPSDGPKNETPRVVVTGTSGDKPESVRIPSANAVETGEALPAPQMFPQPTATFSYIPRVVQTALPESAPEDRPATPVPASTNMASTDTTSADTAPIAANSPAPREIPPPETNAVALPLPPVTTETEAAVAEGSNQTSLPDDANDDPVPRATVENRPRRDDRIQATADRTSDVADTANANPAPAVMQAPLPQIFTEIQPKAFSLDAPADAPVNTPPVSTSDAPKTDTPPVAPPPLMSKDAGQIEPMPAPVSVPAPVLASEPAKAEPAQPEPKIADAQAKPEQDKTTTQTDESAPVPPAGFETLAAVQIAEVEPAPKPARNVSLGKTENDTGSDSVNRDQIAAAVTNELPPPTPAPAINALPNPPQNPQPDLNTAPVAAATVEAPVLNEPVPLNAAPLSDTPANGEPMAKTASSTANDAPAPPRIDTASVALPASPEPKAASAAMPNPAPASEGETAAPAAARHDAPAQTASPAPVQPTIIAAPDASAAPQIALAPAMPAPVTSDTSDAPVQLTLRTVAGLPDVADGMDDLALRIMAKSADGDSRFEIRLDPPELGHIEVSLKLDSEGNAQANVSADKPQTLDLLQRDAPALERALKDAGLSLPAGLSFSLKGDGRSNAFRDGQGNARNRALQIASADAIGAAGSAALAASLQAYGGANTRLDIRV